MGLDNIEFRRIATEMFLQEKQYQLGRKLNRKNLLGRKWDAGGGEGGWLYSLSTIWLKYHEALVQ